VAGCLIGARLWCVPSPCRAGSDATEPIRIEYRAEPGCLSQDEFNAQVFRRTSSARLATSGDTARTFIVVIERRGGTLVGSLVVRQADGTTESREVAGPQCSEVATVLALATALAIDPQASLAPVAEPPPLPTPPPEPPVSRPPPPSNDYPDEPSSPDLEVERAPWVLALGPTLEGGITPRLAYGGSLAVGWRTLTSRSAVSAFGADLTFVRAAAKSSDSPSSSFQLLYLRPALCTVALTWHRTSGIAPCVASELGAVTGSGENVPVTSTRTRAWFSIDLALELHQELGLGWFVEGEASVVLPITRYRYVFRDPTTRVFSVPGAAGLGTIRIGTRL
jgi:hypothetical protein